MVPASDDRTFSGTLASGNLFRVTSYMVEVTKPTGEPIRQIDANAITGLSRDGDAVSIERTGGELTDLRCLSLDDAGRIEALLRPNLRTQTNMRDFNVVQRVTSVGGIIGLFRSQKNAVEAQVGILNRSGYRVTLIVPESRSILQVLLSILLLIITLGIYSTSPDLLIIGERVS